MLGVARRPWGGRRRRACALRLAALLGLLLLAPAAVAVRAAEDLAALTANIALAHRYSPFSVFRFPFSVTPESYGSRRRPPAPDLKGFLPPSARRASTP